MKKNTTDIATTGHLLNCLFQKTAPPTHLDPHPGLIIASHYFIKPYPLVNDVDLICLATMDLLIQFAYPPLLGYGKFTISYTLKRSHGVERNFALGKAIPLTYQDNKLIPMEVVYAHIYPLINKYAEIYDGDYILGIMIRVHMDDKKKDMQVLSIEERESLLSSIIQAGLIEIEPITAKVIQNRKRSYPTHITALKQSRTKLKPFIVADIETIMIDNMHKPYAAGLMMVRPGEQFNDIMIDTYFSEDYSIILDSFEDRSTKVLNDLILRIPSYVRKSKSPLTIYFHNLGRFDGIILLKHLACHHKSYRVKPLMRNHRLYEIVVYSGKNKNMLFRFRDSYHLLPSNLSDLAMNLCPGLGQKGSIPYDEITLSNLASMRQSLLDYMKQDILLLGGVMQKAQEIYWNVYKVDLESKITLASLALSIFRIKYYDEKKWPIHILNKNEDSFIRRGYYGGHVDVYKPYGKDLYYYDVNSLYPFVMKEFQMPGGEPVWHRNLEGMDLDSMFGFIEAYVVCPKTINKPFLPYRGDKNNTLIFPTGEFVGVYYSEELKYARDLGYTVLPISGYLFERMESPFKDFVSSLFESRLEAKKEKNDAMSYVYKILMNSLYGRFGINPQSTITDICDKDQYNRIIRNSEFIFGDMISENNYIVAYHSNTDKGSDYWNPPKNSAVQLAAAITASARIYMYSYTSREDCYYTDTDSVVLSNPIPDDKVSASALGKFKLEDRILEGIFLSPKSYCYTTMENTNVLKYKGPAKEKVSPEWFKSQYADPTRTELVQVTANFRIDWRSLNILKKDSSFTLGIKLNPKRNSVYHENVWVDTEPIDIIDLSSINHIGKQIIKSLQNSLIQQQLSQNNILLDKLSQMEREISERNIEKIHTYKRMLTQSTTEIQTSLTEDRTQTILTEDRTQLDKEEPTEVTKDKEEPTEVTNPTLDEKTKTDEKPKSRPRKTRSATDPP